MSDYTSFSMPWVLPDGSVWTNMIRDDCEVLSLCRVAIGLDGAFHYFILGAPEGQYSAQDVQSMYRLFESMQVLVIPSLRWATGDDLVVDEMKRPQLRSRDMDDPFTFEDLLRGI
jgi:hypothetical protein